MEKIKIFAGFPHEEKGIAALGQKGMALGPAAMVAGGNSKSDIEEQKKKNEVLIADLKVATK
ncbi:MAG TPA: hypothetical protein VFI61_02050 [Patescibacteria group bacterium]|nr:hypothetical protein [Patescibacteria group bacterium]